jgi:uncharacterized protein (TIGR03790 family)
MKKIIFATLLLFPGACAFGQTPENVLLVINESSPVSMDVGKYYAHKRGIPESNILKIKTSAEESVTREIFERQIDAPVAAWLARNFAQDRILYIVLTKGVPLIVTGSTGKDGTTASVDSELALLYRKMLGEAVPAAGPVKNPYFLNEAPLAQAKKFTHEEQDIYLVSRLDGYTFDDIRGLIDRGAAPSREGKILLDAKGSSSEKGNIWLRSAADILQGMELKDRVLLDETENVVKGMDQVFGYYSWGSSDPAIRVRNFGFQFVRGALAGMFVSSDARTFTESSEAWTIGGSGFPQSLAADLIREGVTGIAANVSEPFLEGAVRPDILFPAYMSGFNLIESYYLAMPYLSWQTVVVGDPLCAPFRSSPLSAQEIEKGIDPETELPVIFGKRRLRSLSVTAYKKAGVHPDTIKLILRAEARLVKQDQDGARQDLEAAVARDDRLPAPQLLLASLYEAAREYDKAIERYRRLLQLSPDNPVILNNLAYALAVRKGSVLEALPMAEKAYKLGKGNISIADTLGWIHHLAGQDDKAAKFLEEAVRGGAGNAEMHLHMAVVSAALGNTLAAEVALQRSLEMDPKMAEREEVQQLRKKLKK